MVTTQAITRTQTGVRIATPLLKVLKGLAEYEDMSLGDLLEGIVLLAAGERFVTFGRWLIASASEVWAGLSAILGAGCIFVALSRLGTFWAAAGPRAGGNPDNIRRPARPRQ